MSYKINVVCSCGGLGSQVNIRLQWLSAIEGRGHILTFNKVCNFDHCIWKKMIGNMNIWKKLFDYDKLIFKEEKNKNYIDLPNAINSFKNTGIKNSVIFGGFVKKLGSENFPNFNNFITDNFRRGIKNKEKSLDKYYHYISKNFQKLRNHINSIYNKKLVPQQWILDKQIKFSESDYIIGIHIRSTQHYSFENKFTTYEICNKYFEIIDNIDKTNKKIFIATHMKQIIKLFINKYGKDNIYYIDTLRDNKSIKEKNLNEMKNNDWTKQINEIKKYGVIKYLGEVYLDILMLSQCNLIIGGPSNIFWNALMLNNKNDFIMPEFFKKASGR